MGCRLLTYIDHRVIYDYWRDLSLDGKSHPWRGIIAREIYETWRIE